MAGICVCMFEMKQSTCAGKKKKKKKKKKKSNKKYKDKGVNKEKGTQKKINRGESLELD